MQQDPLLLALWRGEKQTLGLLDKLDQRDPRVAAERTQRAAKVAEIEAELGKK